MCEYALNIRMSQSDIVGFLIVDLSHKNLELDLQLWYFYILLVDFFPSLTPALPKRVRSVRLSLLTSPVSKV